MFTFATKSNPSSSASNKKPQIEQTVLELTAGFSLTKTCFLVSSSSKDFGFIMVENHLFIVSIVNFSSTQNNSARDVYF